MLHQIIVTTSLLPSSWSSSISSSVIHLRTVLSEAVCFFASVVLDFLLGGSPVASLDYVLLEKKKLAIGPAIVDNKAQVEAL